jgi:hypothetical protein
MSFAGCDRDLVPLNFDFTESCNVGLAVLHLSQPFHEAFNPTTL